MKNLKIRILTAIVVLLTVIVAAAQQSPIDYSSMTARSTPDWAREGVIYQIYPRQYSEKGDFDSITKDLPRLKALGVDILWIMPVQPIGELKKKGTIGSPYAIKDYYAINPDYGTKDDFRELVAGAHKLGMKVIIDIVANHTSWDSVLMKNPDFYTKNEKGEIVPPVPDWADVADLNYSNPAVRSYMKDMLKFWISEYDLDGFRCDVAGFIPTDFWEDARREVDKVKSDTFWLAEWHEPDLMVNAFNADYAWALHSSIDEVMHGIKPAQEIHETLERERARFPKKTLHMRFVDNHDERRAIARFGERGVLAAHAFVFLYDGIPLIYNGMEAGDTAESGAPALFEKNPIDWAFAERRPEFAVFYKQMIALRKKYPALTKGDVRWVKNSDGNRVLSFTRSFQGEELLAVINLSSSPFRGNVEVKGEFEEITPDFRSTGRNPVSALPFVPLEGWEFRVFRRKTDQDK
ncbi:MAG: alpha-amylase family glycosyl hydrolase [Pyrinomonadaceae bacterium]